MKDNFLLDTYLRSDFDEKMEWTKTERGGRKLILDGYIYVKKKNLADGWEIYECELRRNRRVCKAKIKVKTSGEDEFKGRTEHNHPSDHGKANAYKVKAAMKRLAVETDKSPQQILLATMYQATDEGLMAMPKLDNIRRCIRRQRQDSQQALKMDRMVEELEVYERQRSIKAQEDFRIPHQNGHGSLAIDARMVEDLGVLETQRTFALGLGLMAQPELNNINGLCIRRQLPVEDVEATESQRSVSPGQDMMAQPELNDIWSSIRRQQRGIHKTFVERRNAEDHRSSFPAVESHVTPQGSRSSQGHHQDIQEALAIHSNTEEQGNPEGHRSSFPAAEGHIALPGLRSTGMHNQDIKETLAMHQNKAKAIEGHRSSFPAAEGHIALPDLRSIRGQHQDIQTAFGIKLEIDDQEVLEGHRSSFPAAEDHITLSDFQRSTRGQHQDIPKAFGIKLEIEDLDTPEGQMLSLAREQLYSHHCSS
ncbi:uncharacterized protein LOC100889712 [Strongylocentrotus purpuratus]|uniref:FLYWCH-type domain-containing protein n=1 Tax=Strongylocentrotus purpuratus TaxID=7668 RepID=A0A7M7GQI1_STRPU|nr:uncharacterized protein LOC100889712 [Strongylocentrotus purpuratus]